MQSPGARHGEGRGAAQAGPDGDLGGHGGLDGRPGVGSAVQEEVEEGDHAHVLLAVGVEHVDVVLDDVDQIVVEVDSGLGGGG